MDNSEIKAGDPLTIIGLMSGTSLDGVDIAQCTFEICDASYTYSIHNCETIAYPREWQDKLRSLHASDAEEYAATHVLYGKYLGLLVHNFTRKYKAPTMWPATGIPSSTSLNECSPAR